MRELAAIFMHICDAYHSNPPYSMLRELGVWLTQIVDAWLILALQRLRMLHCIGGMLPQSQEQ